MLALARKIVSGEEDEDATVESVFAKTHHAEAAAEELLVVGIWPVVEAEAEPTVAELRRNECRGAPYRKNCAARLRRIKLRQFPATGAGLPGQRRDESMGGLGVRRNRLRSASFYAKR